MKPKILLFIPCFNCDEQLKRVLIQLEQPWVKDLISQVLLVDNISDDETYTSACEAASRSGGWIVAAKNNENYGLGGSHKVAYEYALKNQFEWITVLHGDDQGNISDFREILEEQCYLEHDAILGSRFMQNSITIGYSRFRIFGNYIFNFIYSLCLRRRVTDLGSGLNIFNVKSTIKNIKTAPDDLTFNCILLARMIHRKNNILFIPISWRETDQISNVKLVRQAFKTLKIAINSLLYNQSYSEKDFRSSNREYITTISKSNVER